MSIETLTSKYITSAEHVLRTMVKLQGPITVGTEKIELLVEYVRAYLEDAKYYKDQKRLETSLTSIAYCEGLLEALRLIGAVKFDWPVNQK
ncbi:TPA: DUF357 domain-containing protein [Candidatus Bathyarchaeota archaeon]|nr:DUF357 domain-containing protein [Candidatus Bathyarchaeota archaeon]